jgi:toxin ParE1/3/4
MTRYVLSELAESDLDEIWDYTAAHWSRDQANAYILSIRNTCQALADGRLVARAIDQVRPGYQKYPVGSHFLFFRRIDETLIGIVRILHQRMDYVSRL